MQINQLARITGVTPKAIKHYENAGLLTLEKDESGYCERHLHAIKMIKMARTVGFTLREILFVLSLKDAEDSTVRLDYALTLLEQRRSQLDAHEVADKPALHIIEILKTQIIQLFANNEYSLP